MGNVIDQPSSTAMLGPLVSPGKRLHLGEGRVLAQVQVPAEVAVPADDFREHVGAARVPKLSCF